MYLALVPDSKGNKQIIYQGYNTNIESRFTLSQLDYAKELERIRF